MQTYDIKDTGLWKSGKIKIEWVKRNMPLLRGIEEEFAVTKPFAGLRVALSVHLEAKTAYLCKVLASGGAEMYITGSNPLSTQDDVAAALVHDGMNVYAVHGCSQEVYDANLCRVIEPAPNIIIDDGGDLVSLIHTKYPELINNVIGGCEETTTGIIRLIAMNKEKALKFPMVLVNNADCKHLFDNRYGTGQSVWDGINRTTNLIVAGKNVVVAGYGWCGKGVAMRAKGLGAEVIVTEVDPIKAMEAVMDGFKIMRMSEAAAIGDFFITVTEVDMETLKKMAVSKYTARNNIEGYRLDNGKTVFVIAEGRLVNICAGDGHPAEIMDMSFAIQALSAQHLVKNQGNFKDMIIDVPREVDLEVAKRKINYWGFEIDTLTEKQEKYLNNWQ